MSGRETGIAMKPTNRFVGIVAGMALALGCAEDPAEVNSGAGQKVAHQGAPEGLGQILPAITAECVPGGAPLALVKSASPAECTPGGYWVQPAELVNCTDEPMMIESFMSFGCLRIQWDDPSAAIDEIFSGDIASDFPFQSGAGSFRLGDAWADQDNDGNRGIAPGAGMPILLGGHPSRIDEGSGRCGLRGDSGVVHGPVVPVEGPPATGVTFNGALIDEDLALDLPADPSCLAQ